jgi:hypothetical protein
LARHGALEGTGAGTDEEELKELLTGLLDEQANLTAQQKKELLGDIESRKMLFWNGYERECGDDFGYVHTRTAANRVSSGNQVPQGCR